jgi:hypothetical protein
MRRLTIFDSCGPLRQLLWDYVTGTLPTGSADALRVESHLARCPACRAEAQQFRTAASAIDVYKAAPETGIPPRSPDWASVQARLADPQKEPVTSTANRSWFQAMRTSPGFSAATLACGIGITICTLSIPYMLQQDALQTNHNQLLGGISETVTANREGDRFIKSADAKIDAPVEMMVRPIFIGSEGLTFGEGAHSRNTIPLVASLINHTGREMDVQIDAANPSALATNRYTRRLHLASSEAPQQVYLYPTASFDYRMPYQLQVTLTGPFPDQATRVGYSTYNSGKFVLALVGDKSLGVLQPKQEVITAYRKSIQGKNKPYINYVRSATKPEYAPDRVIGYDGVDTIVLGEGAERLDSKQRTALRDWVMSGGSVIVLPGISLDLLGITPGTPFSIPDPIARLLPPETPLRRYALGMGAVLTVGVDPTQPEYREKWELSYAWEGLRNRAAPIMPSKQLGFNSEFQEQSFGNDPFQVNLPPLASLVYLFAGYFVLAVPVTFVVLKRTRRMNWAWVTGPALAAVFGGAIYGFTAELHKAGLSRRTSGVIVTGAGENKARFDGASEIFFPSAGSYDVTVPGAEAIETGMASNKTYKYSSDDPNRESGNGIISRKLEALDNGTSISVPQMTVPNLAFRRFRHTQPVAWGDGIRTRLTRSANGTIKGTIYNGTGRTLNNAYILLQTSTTKTEIHNKRAYDRHFRNAVLLSRLVPGINRIDSELIPLDSNETNFRSLPGSVSMLYTSPVFYKEGAVPVLIATTSGENVGPRIGQYVGGADAVTVAVTLPNIPSATSVTVQGGVK